MSLQCHHYNVITMSLQCHYNVITMTSALVATDTTGFGHLELAEKGED